MGADIYPSNVTVISGEMRRMEYLLRTELSYISNSAEMKAGTATKHDMKAGIATKHDS